MDNNNNPKTATEGGGETVGGGGGGGHEDHQHVVGGADNLLPLPMLPEIHVTPFLTKLTEAEKKELAKEQVRQELEDANALKDIFGLVKEVCSTSSFHCVNVQHK